MERRGRQWAAIGAVLLAGSGAGTAFAFDAPVTVPDSAGGSDPSVAISGAGRAVAAWNVPGTDGDQVALAATGAGGFAPGVVVSDPDALAIDPAVLASDPSGAVALAWTAQPTTGASRIDLVPALGAARETVPGTGADTGEAAVGVAADGTVIVAWTATAGSRTRVFATVRAPGGGYAPRSALSDTAGDASAPTVDVAADGSAVVTWLQTSESDSTSGSITTETSTTRAQASVRSGGAFGPASTVATGTEVTVTDEADDDAPIRIDGDELDDAAGVRADTGATTIAYTRTTVHQQIPRAPDDSVTGRIEVASPGGSGQPLSPPGQDADAPSAAAGAATAAVAWESGGEIWLAGGSGTTFAPASSAGPGEGASAAVAGPAGAPLAAFTRLARPFAAGPLRGATPLAPGDADSAAARASGAPTGYAAVAWQLDPGPADGDELVRVAVEAPAPAATPTPTPSPTRTPTPAPAETPAPAPTAAPTPAPVDTTAPRITRLRLSTGRFLLAPGRSKLRAAALKRGALLRYRLSERAEVRITLVRMALRPGSEGGRRRCPGTRQRSGVVERVGIYEAMLAAGAHRFRLNGRVGRRGLERGRYRLRIRATDAAGNHAPARERRFTLC